MYFLALALNTSINLYHIFSDQDCAQDLAPHPPCRSRRCNRPWPGYGAQCSGGLCQGCRAGRTALIRPRWRCPSQPTCRARSGCCRWQLESLMKDGWQSAEIAFSLEVTLEGSGTAHGNRTSLRISADRILSHNVYYEKSYWIPGPGSRAASQAGAPRAPGPSADRGVGRRRAGDPEHIGCGRCSARRYASTPR